MRRMSILVRMKLATQHHEGQYSLSLSRRSRPPSTSFSNCVVSKYPLAIHITHSK